MEHVNHFRAFYERTLPDGTLEFVATTAGTKRDGLALDMKGAQLDNYLANPVFLWAHDYLGNRLPIGRTTSLKPLAKEMRARVEFDAGDPFAMEVKRKYEGKFLNAVSVGWMDLEHNGTVVSKWELLDISAVPVPGDPQALLRREYAMLRSLVEDEPGEEQPVLIGEPAEEAELLEQAIKRAIEAGIIREDEQAPIAVVHERKAIPPHTTEKADEDTGWDGPAAVAACPAEADALRRMHAWVDPEGDPDVKQSYKLPHHLADDRVVWGGVAAAMARLLQGGTQIPDGDRRGVWNHLERHYQQFDKEAPELRSLAEFGPRLAQGALPNGEWEHYRAELADAVLAQADVLVDAIGQLKAATAPPEVPAAVEVSLVDALGEVAVALKEIKP